MKKLSNVNDDDGDGGDDVDGGKVKVKAVKGEQATGRLHRPVWARKRKSLFLAIPFHESLLYLTAIYPGLLGIATSQSLEVSCLANFLGSTCQ